MAPNPAYKPTSRTTSIFAKVHGFVWIDPEAGQLARVEGEVTEDIVSDCSLRKSIRAATSCRSGTKCALVLDASFSQYDFDGRKFFSPISIHEKTFYSQYHRIGPPKEALAMIRAELGKTAAPSQTPETLSSILGLVLELARPSKERGHYDPGIKLLGGAWVLLGLLFDVIGANAPRPACKAQRRQFRQPPQRCRARAPDPKKTKKVWTNEDVNGFTGPISVVGNSKKSAKQAPTQRQIHNTSRT